IYVSGKKKTKKGKTFTLTDFLAEDSGNSGGTTFVPKPVNWADETDDIEGDVSTAWPEDEGYRNSRIDRSILPTAPRAAREPTIDRNRLPKQPPYTAFLGNLPYDVTEESIKKFFRGLNISAVRLPREPSNPERLKGFGYAEFEDVDSILRALSLNEESLGNRRIRVDIADQAQDKDRDDRSFGRDRDRNREPDKTDSDWRARPNNDSFDDPPPRRGDDSYGDINKKNKSSFLYRDGPRRDDRYDGRDRNRDRYDDRRDRYDDRRDFDRVWRVFRGRRAFGSGFRRDNYDDRREDYRGGGDRYGDRYNDRYDDKSDWRDDRRDERRSDYVPRDDMRREERGSQQRPKLNLKPRSAPKEEETTTTSSSSSSSSSQSSRAASIFGGAKPVDTAAREREVEERLQKEQEKLQRQLEEKEVKGERKPRERHPSWRSEETQERSRTGSESSQTGGTTSTSSGRASRRRESEKSVENEVFKEEEQPQSPGAKSPKQEQLPLKVVPAPPPKENAWAKRSSGSGMGSESEPRSPTGTLPGKPGSGPGGRSGPAFSEDKLPSKGVARKDENKADGVRKDKAFPKSRGGGSSGGPGRGRGDGGNRDNRREADRKESKKDRDSKPASEPKKYEETPVPKFSSVSKYAALLMDGDDEAEEENFD
uniref:Eukaryotic translation initiation factor 4B n=1 Tax=Latimeria chalumnae TaxID=7897 RepID=H3BD23_LATCH